MRKLLIIMLVGMGLSKAFFGRVIPPEVQLTSSTGFNALAEPKAAGTAKDKRADKKKRAWHPRSKGEQHHSPAWLPAQYEPGAWLKNPPHYEPEWLKTPSRFSGPAEAR